MHVWNFWLKILLEYNQQVATQNEKFKYRNQSIILECLKNLEHQVFDARINANGDLMKSSLELWMQSIEILMEQIKTGVLDKYELYGKDEALLKTLFGISYR